MEATDGERSIGKWVRAELRRVVWVMLRMRRRLEGVGVAVVTAMVANMGRHVSLRRCNCKLNNEFGLQILIPGKNHFSN